jgi:hypothetical protein
MMPSKGALNCVSVRCACASAFSPSAFASLALVSDSSVGETTLASARDWVLASSIEA